MLYLKPANFEDLEKLHAFVAAEPADENGFLNDYHDVSLEDFKSTVLPRMIDFSLGKICRKNLFRKLFIFSGVMKEMPVTVLVTKLSGSSSCVII